MVDCRCLVVVAMMHVICLQLLYATDSVQVEPVQLLPGDFHSRWPSVYSRELRNGKYMRFGRASRLPEQLLDGSDMLSDGAEEIWARSRYPALVSDSSYRYLIDRLVRRFMEQRGNDAKVWSDSGEGEKREN